eukprot:6208795-Pleurochrysis_carterae.AAC.2
MLLGLKDRVAARSDPRTRTRRCRRAARPRSARAARGTPATSCRARSFDMASKQQSPRKLTNRKHLAQLSARPNQVPTCQIQVPDNV